MAEKPQMQCLTNEVYFSISYLIGFGSMSPWMDVCSFALIPWVHPARSESLPCEGPGCINRRDRISGTWFVFKLETTSTFYHLFCSCSPHPDLSMQAIQGRCIHSVSTWGGALVSLKSHDYRRREDLSWGKPGKPSAMRETRRPLTLLCVYSFFK